MFPSYKSTHPNMLRAPVLAYDTRSPSARLHEKAAMKTVSFAHDPALATTNHRYNRGVSTDAI